MGNLKSLVRISHFSLAMFSLAACAPFFENGLSWRPTPGAHIVEADLRQSIGYYENAVTAINNRHYALALEYLQAARNQKPDDVRVLTAFGVIYDKLGRFDLSARYYAQAAALDPKSRIIAADMDYSRKLQGISGTSPTVVAADAGADRAQGSWPRTVAALEEKAAIDPPLARPPADAGLARVAQSEEPAMQTRTPVPVLPKAVFLTGHPLAIVDASGGSDTGGFVRTYLSGLGWSVAKNGETKLPARPQTMILYSESMITAAKALARTLSLPMHLTASDSIQGLQLILGSDMSGGDRAVRLLQTRQRQFALAASKPKTRE